MVAPAAGGGLPIAPVTPNGNIVAGSPVLPTAAGTTTGSVLPITGGGSLPGAGAPAVGGGSPTAPAATGSLVIPANDATGLLGTTAAAVPAPPGTTALLIAAGADLSTVSPVFTDPLGLTLLGGPASGDLLPPAPGSRGSGTALVSGGTDPQIGVLGIAPVSDEPVQIAATAVDGLVTGAGLLDTVNGATGGATAPVLDQAAGLLATVTGGGTPPGGGTVGGVTGTVGGITGGAGLPGGGTPPGNGGGGLLGGGTSGGPLGGGISGGGASGGLTGGPSGRAPVAPGPATGPTDAGAGPAGVSAVSSDPLGTTLAGGAAGATTTPLGASGSGVALVAGGKDPQIGVLGIAPETGARLSFEPTAFRGLLTPAGLLAAATDDSLAGSHPSGGGGVIEQVAHAVDGVIAKLPDWSRPIIAGLLVLLLLFGGNSWRTRRRAKKAAMQNKVMQDALVPDLPERVAGSCLSGAYRPADEVAQGGDFYDVFALDEHRAAILLGDVSGHDISALGRSNAVRHKLRTLIEEGYEQGRDLRRALDKASRALSKQWDEGDFVTAVVAVHDAEAGTLTYACAGHPAPVLAGAAAHDPVSVCSSPALGWGLPTGRRQTTVSFGAGDMACFFTDGLTEARVDGVLLDREGLERLVAGLSENASAKAVLDAVIDLAHEADDDLAALVTRSETDVPARRLRIEELEFDARDVRRRAPERFLAACDAPAELIERLAASAPSLPAGGAPAILRVELDGEAGAVEAAIERAPAAATREPVPA